MKTQKLDKDAVWNEIKSVRDKAIEKIKQILEKKYKKDLHFFEYGLHFFEYDSLKLRSSSFELTPEELLCWEYCFRKESYDKTELSRPYIYTTDEMTKETVAYKKHKLESIEKDIIHFTHLLETEKAKKAHLENELREINEDIAR